MRKLNPTTDPTISAFEHSIFNSCTTGELEAIHAHKMIYIYEEGDLLFLEETVSDMFYCVCSGKVKLYKNTSDNRQMILTIAKESDFVGHTLLTDKLHTVSAGALEESVICLIPNRLIFEILEHNKTFRDAYYKTVVESFKGMFIVAHYLAYKPILGRLAAALFRLRDIYQSETNPTGIIYLKRLDLARFIGTARETVIRNLKILKDEGIISATDTGITILDSQKLGFITRLYD